MRRSPAPTPSTPTCGCRWATRRLRRSAAARLRRIASTTSCSTRRHRARSPCIAFRPIRAKRSPWKCSMGPASGSGSRPRTAGTSRRRCSSSWSASGATLARLFSAIACRASDEGERFMPQPKSSRRSSSRGSSSSRASGSRSTAKRSTGSSTPKRSTAAKSGTAKRSTGTSRRGTSAPSTSGARRAGGARSSAATGARGQEEALRRLGEARDLLEKAAVLTRDRIQEAMDDAVDRGRMTRDDAEQLVQDLIKRGRKQADEVRSDMEQLIGRNVLIDASKTARQRVTGAAKAAGRTPVADRARREVDKARRAAGVGPTFPILGYDDLSAGQVTGSLDDLTLAELRKVRDYERRNANRKSVLNAVEKKLA